MESPRCLPVLLALLVSLLHTLSASPARAQSSQLEAALGDLFGVCLFETVEDNPFSQAANLAREALAPGISNFIEASLATIPLTPPNLGVTYVDGRIATRVTGFTPIYTESSATVGQGQFLAGTNASYFNLTTIRGEELSNLAFTFGQDNGGDRIVVTMPFALRASVLTVFGTYGVTDRLDLGIALPIVRLNVEDINTTFRVEGDDSQCRYSPMGVGPNCDGVGERSVSPLLSRFQPIPTTETFLNTLAFRAKYRFPSSLSDATLAAVLDLRLPVGRSSDQVLGKNNFGTRLMLIGEYDGLATFKPYANLGIHFWNGDNSNSLAFASGFSQRIASTVFFSFDLMGKLDIEDSPFLLPIDNAASAQDSPEALSLLQSSIPAVRRDHTLSAGLGIQVAISSVLQVYGGTLFALLDRGLQATVAPSVGAALYF